MLRKIKPRRPGDGNNGVTPATGRRGSIDSNSEQLLLLTLLTQSRWNTLKSVSVNFFLQKSIPDGVKAGSVDLGLRSNL